MTERGRRLLRGIERADSIGLDADKWFFQPCEADYLLVKDVNTLRDAFGVRPGILQDTVWGTNHPSFSDLGLKLNRLPQEWRDRVFTSGPSLGLELSLQHVYSASDSPTR